MSDTLPPLLRDAQLLADYAERNPLNLHKRGLMPDLDVVVLPSYAGPRTEDGSVDVAKLLVPAHTDDVGADLYAADDVVIRPGQTVLIKTGLKMAIPPGYEGQVRPRSGNALKLSLTVLNSPGTVDPPYRNEVGVIVHNARPSFDAEVMDALLDCLNGEKEAAQVSEAYDLFLHANTVHITRGERIGQMVFARFERPTINVVTELSDTTRGMGGFGSTGK